MDVSFIVPLYKGKKYISYIIEIIEKNQKILTENDIKARLEIVFINDFPDEEMRDIDFSNSSDISIHLYENEKNLGIYESRLKGLSKARGFYVVFLDQDDEISPFYLWRQLHYIKKADAVLCNGICRENKIIYKNIKQQKQAVCKDEYISKGTNIISPGQILMKKSSIPTKWLNLKLKKNGSDDVILWVLMLCEKKIFALNPFKDYTHVEMGENTSLDFVNMKESVKEMLAIVNKENLFDNNADRLIFEKACLERISKYEFYINIMEGWQNIVEQIIELCRTKKKIAMYGYGVIGKKLLYDLEQLGIKPEFLIDKDADNFRNTNYTIYKPEHVPEETELIIITPLFAEKQIREELKPFQSVLISLNDLGRI